MKVSSPTNVFFDTSALLGLYVRDKWSKQAHAREAAIDERAHGLATHAFLADWPGLVRTSLDSRLLPEIRRVLRLHALTGADAVQLATALLLCRRLDGELSFACADRRLTSAAASEGLAPAWTWLVIGCYESLGRMRVFLSFGPRAPGQIVEVCAGNGGALPSLAARARPAGMTLTLTLSQGERGPSTSGSGLAACMELVYPPSPARRFDLARMPNRRYRCSG